MNNNQNYLYSIDHINFEKVNSKKDVVRLLESHDKNSFTYSFKTAVFNYALAKVCGITGEEKLRLFFEAGLFHDTGKLGMSYDFINYPGSFTMEMINEMKKHPQGGVEILSKINAERELIDTAKYHHCNYDGTGYVGGLYGEEIPLVARITRISDSVDAYLTKRCYKEGGPTNEALADLMQFSGTSYDPQLLNCFSIIHNNIMEECHKFGEDRPSQDMYMYFLAELYLNDFTIQKAEDVLELF
ncbi:HD-GYP domain-containing protein [Bacillus toyonensis]|uniref:HD-GYP domain-containing protein n=1 Tax=Bacillus toyonensis TaxID=155322 RepID=UPI002E22ED56|nr:HD domain-containing protein [Bacillus toyonensis]